MKAILPCILLVLSQPSPADRASSNRGVNDRIQGTASACRGADVCAQARHALDAMPWTPCKVARRVFIEEEVVSWNYGRGCGRVVAVCGKLPDRSGEDLPSINRRGIQVSGICRIGLHQLEPGEPVQQRFAGRNGFDYARLGQILRLDARRRALPMGGLARQSTGRLG